jgi:phosphosulfolactate phosphohydrolase-like enzyme
MPLKETMRYGSRYGTTADYCEYGNEPSDCIKVEGILTSQEWTLLHKVG